MKEVIIPKEGAKWIHEDFIVIEIKEDNVATDVDCKITYAVWGIFEKTVLGYLKDD